MSEESITPPSTTGNSFDLEIIYDYGKGKGKFKGICGIPLNKIVVFYSWKYSKFIYVFRIRCGVKRFKHRFC